jgi:hypothetical protein
MLVFAQVMAHLPISTFRHCVAADRGDHKVQGFSCLDQFFAMAFAQWAARESLRNIEVNLRAQSARLYHMGFRCKTIARNTLSNANAVRPCQMYADFAQHPDRHRSAVVRQRTVELPRFSGQWKSMILAGSPNVHAKEAQPSGREV